MCLIILLQHVAIGSNNEADVFHGDFKEREREGEKYQTKPIKEIILGFIV